MNNPNNIKIEFPNIKEIDKVEKKQKKISTKKNTTVYLDKWATLALSDYSDSVSKSINKILTTYLSTQFSEQEIEEYKKRSLSEDI